MLSVGRGCLSPVGWYLWTFRPLAASAGLYCGCFTFVRFFAKFPLFDFSPFSGDLIHFRRWVGQDRVRRVKVSQRG